MEDQLAMEDRLATEDRVATEDQLATEGRLATASSFTCQVYKSETMLTLYHIFMGVY